MDHTEPHVLSNLNSLSLLSLRGWLYVCPMILPLLSGCEHPYTPSRASIQRQTQANVEWSPTLIAQPQSGGLGGIGSTTCAGG
jgi:hypothetical protein